MLKKCVLVPNKLLKDEKLAGSSFKRGAMQFEDFNYAMFNPYILLEKDQNEYENFSEEVVELKSGDQAMSRLPVYNYLDLLETKDKKQKEADKDDNSQILVSKKTEEEGSLIPSVEKNLNRVASFEIDQIMRQMN